MDIALMFNGLTVGLAIAAPVGPIGVLCIRRTLTQGKIAGLVSGLGAATADGIYGCIAGFGLTVISTLLVEQQTLLRVVGGLFLCYLGWQTFRSSPSKTSAKIKDTNCWSAYGSTVFLTLTNPLTILSFTAIFAGLGATEIQNNYGLAFLFVLSVFLGSALWWAILVTTVGLFQNQINSRHLSWINRISGVILVAFGIIALSSAIVT
ncbi:LysE family translocator [Roseofilum casamattae]|uniref:LysE family transporter n=1 Tax=Roseofilum casamattae BLCC-M143 TaxID=3022442 RepID=A0ABT7BWL5_9CYAN|nr:LysE family transporter [Roseofilum casamattae]MDJ1183202.1 LysE family transporter [Roseofilum casamattae BLCC-M143]